MRLIGIDAASALMGFFWRHFAPLNRRHLRADLHLAYAMPALTPDERRRILGNMWENLGRTAAETLILPRMIADRRRFEIDASALEPYRADIERGAIFASLHLGNWEFCGLGIRLAGFRVAAVYKPLKNPQAEEFLRAQREPIFDGGLFPRAATTALKLRTLARSGVAIGMLADLRDGTGIDMPFFGHTTKVASFPAVLARRLGVPLIAGRTIRTKGAHFRIEAVPIEIPKTDDAEADIDVATRTLHRLFEQWITEHPEQWMWAHRKWPLPRTH